MKASLDQPYVRRGRLPVAIHMADTSVRRSRALTCHDFPPSGAVPEDAPAHAPVLLRYADRVTRSRADPVGPPSRAEGPHVMS